LTVKKLPLFAIALVAAIPAYWFIWIVVGGPIWDDNYGTFQVEVFKNKAVLTLLILTLIVCALLAFMPFLALIFGRGRESNDLADADADADADASDGGTAVEDDWQADAEVDDDPFVDDGDDGDDGDEDAEELGSETAEFDSDEELDIEGLDEDDIFDEDEDDVFGFEDE
jgi:hypothetical protein